MALTHENRQFTAEHIAAISSLFLGLQCLIKMGIKLLTRVPGVFFYINNIVRHKRKIVAMLISLVAWNGVLGGVDGLMMCLHAAGSLHIANIDPVKECCHESDDASIHACNTCNDLELSSVDMLALRDGDSLLKAIPADAPKIVVHPELVWKAEKCLGPTPTRAPPHSVDVCILVAQTVVLRI